MSTIRSQIVAAAFTALENETEGSGYPAGLTIIPRRASPSEEDTLPLTMVGRAKEDVQHPQDKRVVFRQLTLQLDHWAGGEDAEEQLETQLAWGTKALMADPSLGNLANYVTEDATEWDLEATDTGFARATQRFVVRYPTKANDQETKQ